MYLVEVRMDGLLLNSGWRVAETIYPVLVFGKQQGLVRIFSNFVEESR